MNYKLKPWKKLSKQIIQKARVFDLGVQRMQSPDKTIEDDFFFIDSLDWVQIIPITKNKEIVLVEQFRHGVEQMSIELPGGILNNPNEKPIESAIREMEEETGYQPGAEVIELGQVHPNPAIFNNRNHFFLAEDVTPSGQTNFDDTEQIAIHLEPLDKIPELIKKRVISHTLTVSAFYMLNMHKYS